MLFPVALSSLCGPRFLRRASAALCLAGCSTSTVEPTASQTSAVVGARDSTSREDQVVRLSIRSRETRSCSGTLVGRNVVATARHCVDIGSMSGFSCDRAGELTSPGDNGRFRGTVAADAVDVFAGANPTTEPSAHGQLILTSESTSICLDDIALVILDRRLDSLPRAPIRMTYSTRIGESVTVVGFGDPGRRTSVARQVREGVPVIDIGRESSAQGTGSLPPRVMAVGTSACQGDSGGPALAASGALIGVYSIIDGECDSPRALNSFAIASPHRGIIEAAFAAAGEPLWREGEPDPTKKDLGQPCADAGECKSGACLGEDAAGVCTAPCSVDTTCEVGQRCELGALGDGGGACRPAPAAQPVAPTPPPTSTPSEGCAISRSHAPPGSAGGALALVGVMAMALARGRGPRAHRRSARRRESRGDDQACVTGPTAATGRVTRKVVP